MLRTGLVGVLVLLLGSSAWAQDAKYTVKEGKTAAPKELNEKIAALLGDKVIQVTDSNDKLYCEVWFRNDVPAKASGALNYRTMEQSTLIGAIRVAHKDGWTDFRGQKINPGVYTLRIGFQPEDGDHMGTAPYKEFCLLSPADSDTKPDLIKDKKELFELSEKASGKSHPAVMMLQPVQKPPAAPRLVDNPGNTKVLEWKINLSSGAKKEVLGIGLTLVGKSDAA